MQGSAWRDNYNFVIFPTYLLANFLLGLERFCNSQGETKFIHIFFFQKVYRYKTILFREFYEELLWLKVSNLLHLGVTGVWQIDRHTTLSQTMQFKDWISPVAFKKKKISKKIYQKPVKLLYENTMGNPCFAMPFF